ncbi:MAG: hypothetical protein HN377_03900, partial [Alphaproteobacteria bacterium]|nr:hypothetical protein [Alphaproteobacteria bacterium]
MALKVLTPMKSLGSRLLTVARRIVSAADAVTEYFWELRLYFSFRLPSHGEMNAILRRMGVGGFSEYILAQKQGYFARRSFLPVDRERVVSELNTLYPDEVRIIVKMADTASLGIFNILG